jgi:hypothetical protein
MMMAVRAGFAVLEGKILADLGFKLAHAIP